MTDAFERRLARDLGAYADVRVRPVDAYAVAARVVAGGSRRPWATTMPRVRLGLLLAAAVTASLLVGALLTAGTAHPPVVEASPTALASANPLRVPGDGGWLLDWEASGLHAPILNGDPTQRMGSSLAFSDTQVTLAQGFGAGCEILTGTYERSDRELQIDLPSGFSACNVPMATVVRMDLPLTRSFWIGSEICSRSDGTPEPSPTSTCRTLRLLDANGHTLLVYRAPVVPGVAAPASADPGVALLRQFRWWLDWDATGLDGVAIRTIGPIGSLLTFDSESAFTMWQGYGGGCDLVHGEFAVDGANLTFLYEHSPGGCDGSGPQAVHARLGAVRHFVAGLADCSPSALPPAAAPSSAVFCQTLILQAADGSRLLVYRASP